MNYLKNSVIERLRIRHFGLESSINLLKKSVGGYSLLQTIEKRWFIGRQFSTKTGAYEVYLTMDAPDNADLIARDLIAVDLIKPDLSKMRYRVSTETRPTSLELRWVLLLTAAFNDNSLVDGV